MTKIHRLFSFCIDYNLKDHSLSSKMCHMISTPCALIYFRYDLLPLGEQRKDFMYQGSFYRGLNHSAAYQRIQQSGYILPLRHYMWSWQHCHWEAGRQPSWLLYEYDVLSGRHVSPIYQAPENDWADRLVDVWSYNHRCYHVLVWSRLCMAGSSISRAGGAIRLVGGLDELIRGSGSPSTWMTPERIRVAAMNNEVEDISP